VYTIKVYFQGLEKYEVNNPFLMLLNYYIKTTLRLSLLVGQGSGSLNKSAAALNTTGVLNESQNKKIITNNRLSSTLVDPRQGTLSLSSPGQKG